MTGTGEAGFGAELFLGRLRPDLMDPVPGPGVRLDDASEAFLARLHAFCAKEVDGHRIERDDRIPDEVINGLKEIGAFGIRIPAEYGGQGLPDACYHRALMIVSSVHPSLGELLAGHQSIGLTQPLALSGTEEQKRRLLPRCVREISAFALTEPDIGNDPYRMHTTAVPSEDGTAYTLDGVKLWITNGVLADLLVVMAMVRASGTGPGGMTAFVVEASATGVTVEHRGSFLGLRGLENAVIRLHQVAVPARDRIGGEGEGLEIALAAQDTGRLSIPAVCAAAAKWSLRVAREWSRVRVQWGRPIGAHEAVASKLSFIAATAFALEAMVEVTGRHAGAGDVDTGVEAELAKLYATEKAWSIADELLQVRGGRGYETAASAAARGERGVPVEQALRDLRIGRIFDGSSEALRTFITHDVVTGPFAPDTGAEGAAPAIEESDWPGPLPEHLRYAARASQQLSRHLRDAVERWQDDLGEHQLHLGRLVDIAAELYAMTASCVHAKSRHDQGDAVIELADAFCGQARRRVAELFDRLSHNTDAADRKLAAKVLDGRHTWLEEGVLDPSIEGPWIAAPAPGPSRLPNLRRVIPPPEHL